MPFIIPAILAIGTAVGAALATVATAVGLGGIAGAVTSLAGTAILGFATVGTALALSTVHHSAINAGAQIQWKADKTAGVPYAMGRTGTAGNIVFQDTSNDGHNKWLHSWTTYSIGPIDSFQDFDANQTAVTFSAGVATTSPWASKMWLKTEAGSQPASYISPPSGTGTVPEWTSSHKLSGLASSDWVLQADAKAYPSGAPQPLQVLKGVKVYDPRLDSTYPGGSGTQRSNDETTWTWSENPWLHGLTWCLGRYQNSVRVMGLGALPAQIDVAAYVAGANVADANSWTIGGVVTSKDSKWDVLKTILQAGGGEPARQGALISGLVNTPLVSVATLTGADVLGTPSITGSQPRRSRINTVVPTYRSEAHNWDMVAADPVVISTYVTADGQARSLAVTYTLVQNVTQAAQLAAYDIYNAREFGPVVLQLKPRWNGLKPGDCITINESELGMSSQTLLILTRQRDPATGFPTITCRSETAAKHAAALGQSGTAPPTPSLSAVDLSNVAAPGALAWGAAGGTLVNGLQQVATIVVAGANDNPNAQGILVEYSVAGAGVWNQVTANADATLITIPGVIPQTSYDVRVSTIQRGVVSSSTVASGSPVTSGNGTTYNYNVGGKTTTGTGNTSSSTSTWTDGVILTGVFVAVIGGRGVWQLTATADFVDGATPAILRTMDWRIVTRDTSGGTNTQVLASGIATIASGASTRFAVALQTGDFHANGTNTGAQDVVLQFRQDANCTAPNSIGNPTLAAAYLS